MRIFILLLALTIVLPLRADEEPSISHLPSVVQDRIREWKGEGEVKRVRTRTQPDGSNHYEIEYKDRGDEKTVIFAEDGSVISESGGKGKGKDKDKDKRDKDNKADKRDKDDDDGGEKDDDDNRAVTSPTPRTQTPRPTQTPPSNRPPLTRRPSSSPGAVSIDRLPGQVRYIYFETMPGPVQSAAQAMETQLGPINKKALLVQKKPSGSLYHISYQRASVIFSAAGQPVVQAANTGGPMREISRWEDIPEPVRNAATAAKSAEGDIKTNVMYYQLNEGKTLYHVLYTGENLLSFSPDGRRQDPASYWR